MKAIRYLLLLSIALVAAVLFYFQQQPDAPQQRMLGGNIGGDFTLMSVDGPVSLSDFRGKGVVVYFGYTYCPDVCPTALATLGQALRSMPDEQREQIQGLFISVDPERDTLEHLANYASFFSPQIIGLTSEKSEIDQVVKQYGAFYRRVEMSDSAMEYAVDHTSRLYLVDPEGNLAALVSHNTPPDQLMSNLKQLIGES
ncbi:SCO family protein [Nitrincola iocasae]|jgi:protein SCO1/2|uniref:Redoxin domain-containing protein n=1 Tax=Nitrincola iocasae TaxID=2614693 RepID=A0A5J6LCD5_9GAMM|nr:SCO family protein [Nitrincola iocasae]QEW06076.1 redoxin domain-containing protein [Nitrincola iocasae]